MIQMDRGSTEVHTYISMPSYQSSQRLKLNRVITNTMHDSDRSWETEVHTHISMPSYQSSQRLKIEERLAIPISLDQDRCALIAVANEQLENNISQLKITN